MCGRLDGSEEISLHAVVSGHGCIGPKPPYGCLQFLYGWNSRQYFLLTS